LLYALTDALKLKGPKYGCGLAQCGTCTVLVNGDIVRGCLTLACQLDGAAVETIEGLTESGAIADLQTAFPQRLLRLKRNCPDGQDI
jgi:aerobic-type carbon monoxide dehydrogenase small subunit (CoxS/CutS family)